MIKKFCLLITTLIWHITLPGEKIIGLVQVKNESDIIEYALRALALHTDAIIVLDDASEDDTVKIIQKFAPELNIIEIIHNLTSEWVEGTEAANKQKLLDAGRKHGGTHFVAIDADEIFTTDCADHGWLRNKLLALKKGQILQIPLINLWKSFEDYRSPFDDNFPNICYCTIGYCDDGISSIYYNLKTSYAGFLHIGRFPHVSPTENYPLFVYESDLNHSLIHLPFVNWDNVILKKVWIMMLEIIRLKEGLYNKEMFPQGRSVQDIESFYNTYHNYETNSILTPTPASWLSYPFFKKEPFLQRFSTSKLHDIKQWITIYGLYYFTESSYIYENISYLLQV